VRKRMKLKLRMRVMMTGEGLLYLYA
jgi:hypothetical protein